jgi:DNA-binding PadR family transcriptional regulator
MSLPFLLLGMLRQPATGYDLKKAFDGSLRHFWSAELSQIYPALQRLEEEGKLTSRRSPSDAGPARRVYRRTARGTRALHDWLREEPVPAAVRLPYLGQLCFLGEIEDGAATGAFLRKLREQFAERVAVLRRIEAEWFADEEQLSGEDFHAHLTVRFGVTRAEASIAACDEALARWKRRKERR